MFYYILYLLSILLLIWSIFYGFLITSDIPPSFSMIEMRDYYFISLLMTIFYTMSINKAAYNIKKIIVVLVPVFFIILFLVYGFIHNFIYFKYFNKLIFFMDITLIIELLLICLYGLYRLKKNFYLN